MSDQTDLQGPMWCEQHPQTIWPHDDCAGPGMWLPNNTLRQWGIASISSFDALQSENTDLVKKLLHYEGWFGTDCSCDGDCPL